MTNARPCRDRVALEGPRDDGLTLPDGLPQGRSRDREGEAVDVGGVNATQQGIDDGSADLVTKSFRDELADADVVRVWAGGEGLQAGSQQADGREDPRGDRR